MRDPEIPGLFPEAPRNIHPYPLFVNSFHAFSLRSPRCGTMHRDASAQAVAIRQPRLAVSPLAPPGIRPISRLDVLFATRRAPDPLLFLFGIPICEMGQPFLGASAEAFRSLNQVQDYCRDLFGSTLKIRRGRRAHSPQRTCSTTIFRDGRHMLTCALPIPSCRAPYRRSFGPQAPR